MTSELRASEDRRKNPGMLEHWRQVKAQHQGAILFYRVGDFYEMFYDDAQLAARVLDITLTSRGALLNPAEEQAGFLFCE